YIIERRTLGFTLEEIGKELSLTRERIRQLEAKTLKKVNSIFTKNKCKRFFLDDYYVGSKNTTSLSDRYYAIFLNVISRKMDFKVLRIDREIYYVKNKVFDENMRKFNDVSENLDKLGILFYNEFDDTIMNLEYKNYFLDYFKINANTNCIYKSIKTADKLLSYIKRFNYIDFSDDNIENLKLSLFRFVDIVDFNKRNLISILTRQGSINIGNSKYSSGDILQKIPVNVMEEIKDYIKEHKIVSSEEICKCYKNQLPDFTTPSMVYYFMKEHYADMFNFGGNTLMISTRDTAASKAVLIFEHIKNSFEPVANVELLDKYKVNKTSLSVIVQQNSDIIYLDDVYLWLISQMKNSEIIMRKVEFYVKQHTSFFAIDLYKYILYNSRELLEQDFITTFERFLKFLKAFCKDLLLDYEYDRFKKKYSKKQVQVGSFGFESDF
ncbi:MAG: hypothetical protein K2K48_03450, partial [Anaeroplasmataceae bacterium]|nr:hypothetical protein [Anaeroplasmataceae bacterium]